MEEVKQSKLRKISNVEKNFMYQCEICYQDYDTLNHIPMIICQNYHAVCSKCVNSNVFKQQYNAHKNPTGRYMCVKCSKIIVKQNITQHKILKQVCQYIQIIKKKDQQMRKQFYNYVGTMGMNLVAIRQDYDSIQKNNLLLSKENQKLIKENLKLKDQFIEIQKIKGSFEQLQKLAKQVQEMNQNIQMQKATLESLKDQVDRKNNQISRKRNEILQQNKRYFEVQSQITQLRQQMRIISKQNKQLMQANQGAINLRQYLQQEINNLQNQKKQLIKENTNKKSKMNESIKMMQQYWEKILESNEVPVFNIEKNVKINEVKKQKSIILPQKKQEKIKIQEKIIPLREERNKKQYHFKIDYNEKSIKNFYIEDMYVTLNNQKLSSFTNISLQNSFDFNEPHFFTINVKKLKSSQQIMIGLMTQECKNKKNVYNRKGFFAIDGASKYWCQGNTEPIKFKINQGDQIKFELYPQRSELIWSKNGYKDVQRRKLPQNFKKRPLYPVVLLIQNKDSIQFTEFK